MRVGPSPRLALSIASTATSLTCQDEKKRTSLRMTSLQDQADILQDGVGARGRVGGHGGQQEGVEQSNARGMTICADKTPKCYLLRGVCEGNTGVGQWLPLNHLFLQSLLMGLQQLVTGHNMIQRSTRKCWTEGCQGLRRLVGIGSRGKGGGEERRVYGKGCAGRPASIYVC